MPKDHYRRGADQNIANSMRQFRHPRLASGLSKAAGTPKTDRPGKPAGRCRIFWEVCDEKGRSVQSFEHSKKTEAEAIVASEVSQGKSWFLRRGKESF